jgi:hypothetical protein
MLVPVAKKRNPSSALNGGNRTPARVLRYSECRFVFPWHELALLSTLCAGGVENSSFDKPLVTGSNPVPFFKGGIAQKEEQRQQLFSPHSPAQFTSRSGG